MIYRIYNIKLNKYSNKGINSFTKTGKLWGNIGNLKRHLSQYYQHISYIEQWKNMIYKEGRSNYDYYIKAQSAMRDNLIVLDYNSKLALSYSKFSMIPKELEIIEYDDNLVEIRRFNARKFYPEYI